MDHQPSVGEGSQLKARKRPLDSDPSSSGLETSTYRPIGPKLLRPGASVDGAATSKAFSSPPEESDKASNGEDSADSEGYTKGSLGSEDSTDAESSADDSVTSGHSSGTESSDTDEHAGPVPSADLKNLNGRFTGATLDHWLPCTATEGTTCQIVSHLSAWNEFLCLISWQLRETSGTTGKLSLVFFREPSSRHCSPQQLHQVTLLVCGLLKTHRCVAHIELDSLLFMSHHQLLSDALRGNAFITSVKLTFYGFCSGENLALAALSLTRLQELECAGYAQHTATLVAGLSTFLRTTTSLTALRISQRSPKGLSSEEFFRALGQNSSLKELMLPSCVIAETSPTARAVFTEWLKSSTSLTSLTVAADCNGEMSLKCVLEGLLGSRSVVAVVFECCAIDQADVQLISKIFEQNKVLQSFKISCEAWYNTTRPSFVLEHPTKADYDRWLEALVSNDTLEQVALPIKFWDADQWKLLFEALPTKRSLKVVAIEAPYERPPLLHKLCVALKETGADEKVSFNTSFIAEELDEGFLCKAFSEVFVRATDRNRAVVCRLLERLPSLDHITSLHLHFDLKFDLNGVPSSTLATFLGATCTLKTLALSADWDVWLYDCQEAVMKGLDVNTSLKELRVEVQKTRNDFSVFTEPLADAINASKNISRVYYDVGGQRCEERAFFQRLSTGIADNYTLLSVTGLNTSLFGKPKSYWFDVWDTTRRNCGLVTGAADFARGARRNRHCALALERVHGHPELVEEVAKLEYVDEARAAAMVRDGLRSMEGMHVFMRLAGVVKERVMCHVRRDGRTQLDDLNEHCWSAVRCYLKLHDIRDSTRVVEELSTWSVVELDKSPPIKLN